MAARVSNAPAAGTEDLGSAPEADKNIRRVVEICYEMLELADHGDKFRRDEGCGVVFGALRDEAYKIRQLAEKELERHRRSRSGGRKR